MNNKVLEHEEENSVNYKEAIKDRKGIIIIVYLALFVTGIYNYMKGDFIIKQQIIIFVVFSLIIIASVSITAGSKNIKTINIYNVFATLCVLAIMILVNIFYSSNQFMLILIGLWIFLEIKRMIRAYES